MKTLLLKKTSLRVSVMSFHHEIFYSIMRAYFEALVSQVFIWDDRAYGLLWNAQMVDDINNRIKVAERDPKRWRLYAVLFGVINLRRELRIVPFRDALEEHMNTGLTVAAVAVMDLDLVYQTFGTKNIPEDILEDFVNKYNAWHNSFDWFVRIFENGHLKSENRICPTMDDVIMWLKHQPELVDVKITPKQFADARHDVEADFGVLVMKNFVISGLHDLTKHQFQEGAAALRAEYDNLVKVHEALHDPETLGSVFWGSDSVVALLSNSIGFTLKRDDMDFVRISAPVGTPMHIVDGLRRMLDAFRRHARAQVSVIESDDIDIASHVDGEGSIPTLSECHRQLCEAIGQIR